MGCAGRQIAQQLVQLRSELIASFFIGYVGGQSQDGLTTLVYLFHFALSPVLDAHSQLKIVNVGRGSSGWKTDQLGPARHAARAAAHQVQ